VAVRFVRTAVVAPGKGQEAAAFAGKMSEYLTGLGMDSHWGMEVGGTYGTIVWFSDFPDMAGLEASNGKLLADAGYNDLVNSAATLFNAGSGRDRLFMLM
jgi:hypothetical protein